MKLSDIYSLSEAQKRQSKGSVKIADIDFFDTHGIQPFGVKITFEHTPADHDDHPYGSTTARMDYPSHVDIDTIVSTTKVEQTDDDDKVIKTWPIGTDVMKLPGWNKKHLEWFEQQALKEVEEE